MTIDPAAAERPNTGRPRKSDRPDYIGVRMPASLRQQVVEYRNLTGAPSLTAAFVALLRQGLNAVYGRLPKLTGGQ